MTTLYIVIPCYNEEEMLPITAAALEKKMQALAVAGRITPKSRVVFVDDGSKDGTREVIRRLHGENPLFSGVFLTRNRGHQNALLAGLMTVRGDCDVTVSMDADLQDDIDVIDEMLRQYEEEGCQIVYGVRSGRKQDSAFKRGSARFFYRLMRRMGVETVYDHADCRLMSARALEALSGFREVNLFLRGLVPLLGFKSGIATYERGVRKAGKSKYPLRKMLAFAFEGITSLSIKPIRLIATLGMIIFLVSIGFLVWAIVNRFLGYTADGWASLMASIWALGGLQLLSIGVVGEYIGKIYLETKHRPRYLVEEYLK